MIKKGISIILLFIYLMVNFMPYVPYIYATSHKSEIDLNISKSILFSSSNINTGDICYVKAITKRYADKKEKKKPQIIIVNNLEFTPLYSKLDIRSFFSKKFKYKEYKAILVNHIKQPNSPPPKNTV